MVVHPTGLRGGGGRVAAQGHTRQILADDSVMAANRLELPYGFTLNAADR